MLVKVFKTESPKRGFRTDEILMFERKKSRDGSQSMSQYLLRPQDDGTGNWLVTEDELSEFKNWLSKKVTKTSAKCLVVTVKSVWAEHLLPGINKLPPGEKAKIETAANLAQFPVYLIWA